jgi:hypothetical protein
MHSIRVNTTIGITVIALAGMGASGAILYFSNQANSGSMATYKPAYATSSSDVQGARVNGQHTQ